MLSLRPVMYSNLYKCKKLSKVVFLSNKYSLSTQSAVQPVQEENEKSLKSFETLKSMTKKIRQKEPQKPPFAKNLFLGIFDTDILTYPQLKNEDTNILEPAVAAVEKLVEQEHMVNCNTLSNKNFRQNLSDYKAIGLQVPQLVGGRECYVSESSRFLEAISSHNLRDNLVYNEQLGVQALNKFGNDLLKTKYLSRLMTGDSLSAFCMCELDLPDISSITTKASYSEDENVLILNGNKAWVVNGSSADVLIVVAMTDLIVRDTIKDPKLTLFVVDGDSSGITRTKVNSDGTDLAHIEFNNTPVPKENIIGEFNKGDKVLSSIMTEFRLGTSPICIALSKKILKELAASILEQSNDKNLLHKTDAIRGKIGEIITNLYAMESVLYLTTGLIDSYENQDCELESTIVKVFSSQSCLNASLTALDLIGSSALSESHWIHRFHKDALRQTYLHESNDNLKIMMSLIGLQFAGFTLKDRIEKIRNPLFHGGFTFRRMWTNRRNIEDNPKLNLGLGDYLHPSLLGASQCLEYCVKRLEFASEILLANFGPEVLSQHMDLRRLADCIIDIYVMTACIGRASRSYCIGLQHGELEVTIAAVFCSYAKERVKYNVRKIFGGENLTNDKHYKTLSKQLFKSKSYYLKHPLTRNF